MNFFLILLHEINNDGWNRQCTRKSFKIWNRTNGKEIPMAIAWITHLYSKYNWLFSNRHPDYAGTKGEYNN